MDFTVSLLETATHDI